MIAILDDPDSILLYTEMSKLALGLGYLRSKKSKPVTEELAPNATNTQIINTKRYLVFAKILDQKNWTSYALILHSVKNGRYKKIKRRWIDKEGKILDLTNEDYNEFMIVEQSELDSLSEDTKIYDLSKEDLRPY